MDLDKFAMLKGSIKQLTSVSIAFIKSAFNVENEEAEEMMQKLVQAGLIEAFPVDGINYLVKK